MIAKGNKLGGLYLLESQNEVGGTMAIPNNGTKLWHKISNNSPHQEVKEEKLK